MNDNRLNEANNAVANFNWKKELWEWAKALVVAVILALIITNYVFTQTIVDGSSMEPTLHHKDRVIMLRKPLLYRNPDYRDIIVFKPLLDTNKDFVKRIVGLPGDEIAIVDGKVFRNGEAIEEDYIDEGVYTEVTGFDYKWIIQDGYCFVLGDNRHPGGSTDSRLLGPIPIDSIKGVIRFRIWPLGSDSFGNIN